MDFYVKDFYVKIDELAPNAFIYYSNTNPEIKFLSYTAIYEYTGEVAQILRGMNHGLYLCWDRDATHNFLYRNSDYFKEAVRDGYHGVLLKDGITIDNLIGRFTGYLPLDLYFALQLKPSPFKDPPLK